VTRSKVKILAAWLTNWSPFILKGTPIFHVSFLKNVIGDKIPIQTILSKLEDERKFILELETRTKQLHNRAIIEYLIKWKKLPAEDSTCEDESFIQKHPTP
jgi:hypothetical protein